MTRQLQLLPPAKPRLGLYLRPGRNDHTVFLQLLAEGRSVSGLVLDARHSVRHRSLREALVDNGVHAVLDSNFMELATTGGGTLAGLQHLPWSDLGGAAPSDLRSTQGRKLAVEIAEEVRIGEYSAVLAPTHLLANVADGQFAADRTVSGLTQGGARQARSPRRRNFLSPGPPRCSAPRSNAARCDRRRPEERRHRRPMATDPSIRDIVGRTACPSTLHRGRMGPAADWRSTRRRAHGNRWNCADGVRCRGWN